MAQPPSASSEIGGLPGMQLPWAAIPKFIPGSTDVTEYSRKMEFLAAMWPKEHLPLLAPRAALLCEGTAFKKLASLPPSKLQSTDDSGVKLLVSTLGGSWGKTVLEEKYDRFEKAIYGTVQKADETNDSYLARHDVHFEELVSQGVTLSEVRAYILLRQSQLSAEDRKKIVVEMGGTLDHTKVGASIRLLGSRFFSDLQGLRGSARNKTYDANITEETATDETERAYQATSSIPNSEEPETEIDGEYLEAMIAAEDQDALQVQAFEEELEGFFQETPDLQEALISYLDARNRLLQKKKARGFWPVSSSKGGKSHRGFKGKGRGKSAAQNQLLARIARSTCRACGERGHWRAECPKYGKPGSMSNKGEATTTFADVPEDSLAAASSQDGQTTEVFTSVPADALQADSGETSPADASGVPQQRAACAWRSKRAAPPMQVPHSSAHALLSSGSVEAILDTGASRCVMGKSLVSTFLSQLSDVVRDQVKVTQSAVRFRFGNNQTLVSERRILIPLRTANSSILWLGIEVVPGGTPLLLSKKAIKQLGGVIDTTADVCHLKRLQKKLQLRTGPTGLYMVDLARLCEESSQELQCHIVREDCFDETPQIRICMSTDQFRLSPRFPIALTPRVPCIMAMSKAKASPQSNLGARFARLQDPAMNYTMAEIENLSVETLGEFKIDFGRTMKGRTYMEVAETEKDWVKWCCDHLAKSEKRCHQVFMIFIEKYIEAAEETEATLLYATEPSNVPVHPSPRTPSLMQPASKAAPKRAPQPSEPSQDQWDVVSTTEGPSVITEQVNSLTSRMNQMENVMQQVLGAVQALHAQSQAA
ncbi:unnamed protein product [Symbiodinium natans]|uniref:CCHC-type domain-containing protein n=1 Tax=Symbiodinium natans TaxID=878477 RepID=A0A812R6C6_9DINO|nr:unnamed protein product [Symbiodinium natans]